MISLKELAEYYFYLSEQEVLEHKEDPKAFLMKSANAARRFTYHSSYHTFQTYTDGQVHFWLEGTDRSGNPDVITNIDQLSDALLGREKQLNLF